MIRCAVIRFPGTNCEEETLRAIDATTGLCAQVVWHTQRSLADYDAVVLPGGFSYGDYLRSGAIARFSPIMEEVGRLAREGAPILGICNGFQVLTEAGLLPGALRSNAALQFRCDVVAVRVETTRTPWTTGLQRRARVELPIAHAHGAYTASARTLDELRANDQVVLRYDGENPNGSLDDIAGVCNLEGNVVGMMPHPERAVDELLGLVDGRAFLSSLTAAATATTTTPTAVAHA